MKRDNVNYVLVGLVVVAAFILLMVTLAMGFTIPTPVVE